LQKGLEATVFTRESSCCFQRVLYGVYTCQQTSGISTCILNTFAGSLLDVCWIM